MAALAALLLAVLLLGPCRAAPISSGGGGGGILSCLLLLAAAADSGLKVLVQVLVSGHGIASNVLLWLRLPPAVANIEQGGQLLHREAAAQVAPQPLSMRVGCPRRLRVRAVHNSGGMLQQMLQPLAVRAAAAGGRLCGRRCRTLLLVLQRLLRGSRWLQ